MRIACALATTVAQALELYDLFSLLEYLPSSPTLFNAGTRHEQLSSCFLVDSPQDHLEDIYQRYADVAMLIRRLGLALRAGPPVRPVTPRSLSANATNPTALARRCAESIAAVTGAACGRAGLMDVIALLIILPLFRHRRRAPMGAAARSSAVSGREAGGRRTVRHQPPRGRPEGYR
jgi:ribonucleotide reductase alpha subunit